MKALSHLSARLAALEQTRAGRVVVVEMHDASGKYLTPEDARKAAAADAAGGLVVCLRRFGGEAPAWR